MISLDNTKPIKARFNTRAEKNNLEHPTRTFLKKDDTHGRSKALIEKTKRHYQKHAKTWIAKEHMRLRMKDAPRLDYEPKGSPGQSRDQQLRIKAEKTIYHQRYRQRIERIKNIRDRGLQRSGKSR